MKLVPLVTLVHMDIKAFPSSPSVIRNSIVYHRSRWYSQIAFPTVLMFFLVTQVTVKTRAAS
ncbi:hypothetical protein T12_7325, partial [Trichinella patagoniensis]